MNFVKEQFKGTDKEWVLLVCIGASSGVGRLAFGKIGDRSYSWSQEDIHAGKQAGLVGGLVT